MLSTIFTQISKKWKGEKVDKYIGKVGRCKDGKVERGRVPWKSSRWKDGKLERWKGTLGKWKVERLTGGKVER